MIIGGFRMEEKEECLYVIDYKILKICRVTGNKCIKNGKNKNCYIYRYENLEV